MNVSRATRTGAAMLAAIALASLAACGGGSDTPPPASTPPVVDARLEVDAITVFGDSLSDVGTYAVTTGDAANKGKFTVNPGNIWVENIAAHYGLKLSANRSLTLDKDASYGATTQVGTATVVGGNGYAEGGARVAAFPSESGVGNNLLVAPVSTQIDNYLATHAKVGAHELVVVDGGGNDTYAQFSAICWGTDDNQLGSLNTTLAIANAQIEAAAQAQVANVKRLVDHGAPLVLVGAASDWSPNPFGQYYLGDAYQSQPLPHGCYNKVTAAQITAWTTRFNDILRQGVAGLTGVIYLDTDNAFVGALANPAKFGFTNIQAPACNNTTPTSSASFCTAATLAAPDAAQTYFWSDAFHPTPHGHKLLSDYAITLLDKAAQPAASN